MTTSRDPVPELTDKTAEEFVALLLDSPPWIFDHLGPSAYDSWRSDLVAGTAIRPDFVFIVGSAALGVSIVPQKAGRRFRPLDHKDGPSDIDIAVVDEDLFVESWETILTYDRRRALGFGPDRRERIRQGVYWGHVSSPIIPASTRPARTVRRLLASSGRQQPLRGHPASIRVYRRAEDLRSYQEQSFSHLQRTAKAGATP